MSMREKKRRKEGSINWDHQQQRWRAIQKESKASGLVVRLRHGCVVFQSPSRMMSRDATLVKGQNHQHSSKGSATVLNSCMLSVIVFCLVPPPRTCSALCTSSKKEGAEASLAPSSSAATKRACLRCCNEGRGRQAGLGVAWKHGRA